MQLPFDLAKKDHNGVALQSKLQTRFVWRTPVGLG